MSDAMAARLRQLARDHYEGRLDYEAYLRARGQILDSLVGLSPPADDDPGVVTQPRRPTGEYAATTGELAAAPAAAPPAQQPPAQRPALHISPPLPATPPPATSPSASTKPRKLSALALGGVAVLVLGIAISWLLISGALPKLFGGSAGTTATPEAANPARVLIDDFLLAGDWNDSTVAQFNLHWKSLGVEERRQVFDNLWHRDLAEAVRTRVKQQRALAAGAEEVRIAGPLAELAATFGVDVSAPDRIVLPAAIREPAAAARTDAEGLSGRSPAPPVAKTAPEPAASTQSPATRAATKGAAPSTREAATARAAAKSDKPAAAAPVAATTTHKVLYPECIAVPVRSRLPLCQDRLASGGFGPVIALMPAASFQMGSSAAPEERPVRTVTLARPIGISQHEVSQAEFRAFASATGRAFPQQPADDNDRPVVNVTWHEARAYAEWLSSATGQRYRLPSEAEWEYAARAGETGLYPHGTQLAITDAHFTGAGKPAGLASRKDKFNYNAFRLYHVVGNAREWVLDGWTPNFEGAPADGTPRSADAAGTRVVRGGAYTDTTAKLRLTMRERLAADARDAVTGFRVLREIP